MKAFGFNLKHRGYNKECVYVRIIIIHFYREVLCRPSQSLRMSEKCRTQVLKLGHQYRVMPLLMLPWETSFENHLPGDSAQILAAAGSIKEATNHSLAARQHSEENATRTYPAKALDTDIAGVLAARSPIDHSVSELIVGCVTGHPAEQLATVLHQN